ncbi:MAG: hypothetical protein WCC93_04485 [Chthoniobacterales bacterium]
MTLLFHPCHQAWSMLVVILGTTISQTDDGNEEAEQKIFQPLRLWIQRMNCGHELDDCTNSSQFPR